MSTLADRTISALRANHEHLTARVGGCDDEDLARQSGSAKWDVSQVLGHLGSGAEISLATLEAGTTGEESPGQGFSEAVWDRWNAMSRREKAEGFLRANEQLVTAFEALDATAREQLHVELSFLPFPADVAVLSGMRLNEAALHGWDVRVAFDQDATLASEETAALLEQLTGPLSFMVGFLGKPDALSGTKATVRVEATDPDQAFGLVLGESISLGDPPAEVDADAVLAGPAEAWLRLFAGRLDESHTPDTMIIASEKVTLDQLRRAFPGF